MILHQKGSNLSVYGISMNGRISNLAYRDGSLNLIRLIQYYWIATTYNTRRIEPIGLTKRPWPAWFNVLIVQIVNFLIIQQTSNPKSYWRQNYAISPFYTLRAFLLEYKPDLSIGNYQFQQFQIANCKKTCKK